MMQEYHYQNSNTDKLQQERSPICISHASIYSLHDLYSYIFQGYLARQQAIRAK